MEEQNIWSEGNGESEPTIANTSNIHCLNFTTSVRRFTHVARPTISALGALASLVGIVVIVGVMIKDKKYRTFYYRLILFLMVSTLCGGITQALSVLPLNEDYKDIHVKEGGWERACEIIGYFSEMSAWLEHVAIAWITVYIILTIHPRTRGNNIVKYFCETVGTCVWLLTPFLLCWIPFVTGSYGLSGLWCWIKSTNEDCSEFFISGLLYQLFLYYAPFIVLLLFNIITMFIVSCYIIYMYWGRSTRTALKVVITLCLYPIVYDILFSIAFANRIYYAVTVIHRGSPDYDLWIAQTLAESGRSFYPPCIVLIQSTVSYIYGKYKHSRHIQITGTEYIVSRKNVTINSQAASYKDSSYYSYELPSFLSHPSDASWSEHGNSLEIQYSQEEFLTDPILETGEVSQNPPITDEVTSTYSSCSPAANPFREKPFTDTIICTASGLDYDNKLHGIKLSIPESAITHGMELEISIEVYLCGNFSFPEGISPVSAIVCLCTINKSNFQFLKPIEVTVPHFLNNQSTKENEIYFLKASHQPTASTELQLYPAEEEDFSFIANKGVLHIHHLCCCLCIAAATHNQLQRQRFCVTCAVPRSITSKSTFYFYITYFIPTCISNLPINEELSLIKQRTFRFLDVPQGMHKIRGKWWFAGSEEQFDLVYPAEITPEEISFWRLYQHKELEIKKAMGLYPPNMRLTIGELSPSKEQTIIVSFEGTQESEEEMKIEITIPCNKDTTTEPQSCSVQEQLSQQQYDIPMGLTLTSDKVQEQGISNSATENQEQEIPVSTKKEQKSKETGPDLAEFKIQKQIKQGALTSKISPEILTPINCLLDLPENLPEFVDPVEIIHCNVSGGVYHNPIHGITLHIPKGAIPYGMELEISIGICLHGSFSFPEGLSPVSAIVWFCILKKGNFCFLKPVEVVVPHFLDCQSAEDAKSLEMCFLKASHQPTAAKEFQFHPSEGLMDFTSYTDRGTLHTRHFCFDCIAAKIADEQLKKKKFCVTLAVPRPITSWSTMYFYITYYIPTCIDNLEQLIQKEGLHIEEERRFHFSGQLHDHSLRGVLVTSSGNPLSVTLQPKLITMEDLDFWQLERDGYLKLLIKRKEYPPNMKLRIGELSPSTEYIITVNFKGTEESEEKMAIDITIPRSNSSDKPTIRQLTLLKTETRQHPFRILETLVPQWETLGYTIDFDPQGDHVQTIKRCEGDNPLSCCRQVLMDWLHGQGSYQPANWESLFELLKDVKEVHLADELQSLFLSRNVT